MIFNKAFLFHNFGLFWLIQSEDQSGYDFYKAYLGTKQASVQESVALFLKIFLLQHFKTGTR